MHSQLLCPPLLSTPQQRWDTGSYLTIRSTQYQHGNLRIRFADGEEGAVPIDRFASTRLVSPDWSSVTAGPLWITVPTAIGDIEISWLAMRLLIDPEFRTYWETWSPEATATKR
jgi:hypothetical protein